MTKPNELPLFLPIHPAVQMLFGAHVSKGTANRMARRGLLPVRVVGGRRVIARADIERMAQPTMTPSYAD